MSDGTMYIAGHEHKCGHYYECVHEHSEHDKDGCLEFHQTWECIYCKHEQYVVTDEEHFHDDADDEGWR